MKQEQLAKYNRITKDMKNELENIQIADKRMAKRVSDGSLQTVDVDEHIRQTSTAGKKIADKVAKVGGSWGFVIVFVIILISWMAINALSLFGLHFDPYPFILLNLFLSCVSAIQAPIIMMSQNRAGELDSMTRDNDYKTNQKSEIQLKLVHSKLDYMIRYQQHLAELVELDIKMNDKQTKD